MNGGILLSLAWQLAVLIAVWLILKVLSISNRWLDLVFVILGIIIVASALYSAGKLNRTK